MDPWPICANLPAPHRPNVLFNVSYHCTPLDYSYTWHLGTCLPGLGGFCHCLAHKRSGWLERCPPKNSLGFVCFTCYPLTEAWHALSTGEDESPLFQNSQRSTDHSKTENCFKTSNFCTHLKTFSEPRRNYKGI